MHVGACAYTCVGVGSGDSLKCHPFNLYTFPSKQLSLISLEFSHEAMRAAQKPQGCLNYAFLVNMNPIHPSFKLGFRDQTGLLKLRGQDFTN